MLTHKGHSLEKGFCEILMALHNFFSDRIYLDGFRRFNRGYFGSKGMFLKVEDNSGSKNMGNGMDGMRTMGALIADPS